MFVDVDDEEEEEEAEAKEEEIGCDEEEVWMDLVGMLIGADIVPKNQSSKRVGEKLVCRKSVRWRWLSRCSKNRSIRPQKAAKSSKFRKSMHSKPQKRWLGYHSRP